MADITVKQLGVEDWENYRRVRLAALQDSPAAFVASLEAEQSESEEFWRERMRRSLRLVAMVDSQPVGVVSVGAADEEENAGELFGLWVHPDHRGSGVATELVRAGQRARLRPAETSCTTGSVPRMAGRSPLPPATASGPRTIGARCAW